MPPKNSPLDTTRTILTIIVSAIGIVTIITSYAAGRMDDLTKKHNEDIAEVKQDINQRAVERYTDQIHILESNPSATAHDRNTVKYLKGRKADLVLKMKWNRPYKQAEKSMQWIYALECLHIFQLYTQYFYCVTRTQAR